jgi:lysophospholipase L1-like esterase
VSTFEFWFARHERGGKVEIAIDGDEPVVIDTKAPELEDAWHTVYAPAGQHKFVVRTRVGGSVRAYGVLLENDGPGVVWDGMSLIGGSTRGLRTQHRAHIAAQVKRRGLDLIAFMFGGNDLARKYVDLKESLEPYYEEYTEVVRNFRAGRPGAACLIMSVIDHGERKADNTIVSRPFAKVLANAQREVARRAGCAFFDTFGAMGGTGSAGRWYRANPRLMAPDLGHPTGSGHEVIAGLFSHALLYGYDQYRLKMAGKPLRLPPKGVDVTPSDANPQ